MRWTIAPLLILACSTAHAQTNDLRVTVQVDRRMGTAEVAISGGTEPYTVTWTDERTGTVVSELGLGRYAVNVVDAEGLQAMTTFIIGPNAERMTGAYACDQDRSFARSGLCCRSDERPYYRPESLEEAMNSGAVRVGSCPIPSHLLP